MRNKLFLFGMILMFLPSLISADANLVISPNGTFFDLQNILPGDSFSKEVNLTNSGSMLIPEINISADFENDCAPVEPNDFCSGNPNLTDVLKCALIYNGINVANKTITELKQGFLLDGLNVDETKTLNIAITFYPLAGNKYQATSAIVNFSFTALPPDVINEIMYNPSDEQGGDNCSEWIELYNPTNESINLSEWNLCDDELLGGYINYTDKNTYSDDGVILLPNQYAIITDGGNGTKVYQYFNVSDNVLALHVNADSLCTGLNNSGDIINLVDNHGNLIDNVTYKDIAEEGKTIERVNPWKQSSYIGGTPGGLNSIVLRISNVSVNTAGDLVYSVANITHYFNLSRAEMWAVRNSDNKIYIENLSTTDNQIYNGTWNTSLVEDGEYTIYIYAQDEKSNNKLFNSGFKVIKNSPPVVAPTGGGGGRELRKAYLVMNPTGATIQQNETGYFEIEIRNIGSLDINSFELFATDSEAEDWITIAPSEEKLGIGETKFWTMTISVPVNAEVGTKYFTIYANGDELSSSVDFTLTIAKKPEEFIGEEKPEIFENATCPIPTNLIILINHGDETTSSVNVSLVLSAMNATWCRLNNDGIAWSEWEDYTISKGWKLSPAPGTKTVYYQCKNRFGESEITYETIEYIVPETTLPTGLAILTNPAVLTSIIGGLILLLSAFFLRKKKLILE